MHSYLPQVPETCNWKACSAASTDYISSEAEWEAPFQHRRMWHCISPGKNHADIRRQSTRIYKALYAALLFTETVLKFTLFCD